MTKLLLLTYVNDIISGKNSEDEMLDFYMLSKRVFQEKGFNLQKIRTNFKQSQEQINILETVYSPKSELTHSETNLGTDQPIQNVGEKSTGNSMESWNRFSSFSMFEI